MRGDKTGGVTNWRGGVDGGGVVCVERSKVRKIQASSYHINVSGATFPEAQTSTFQKLLNTSQFVLVLMEQTSTAFRT